MEGFVMIRVDYRFFQFWKTTALLITCQPILVFGFLFSVLLYPHTTFSAYLTQAWVARYNGPGNGVDQAVASNVDTTGNVYITGNSHSGSSFDYATVKYDTNGTQLWVARYNGPGNG